jgi:glycosyltransferase involved in cell wall biosynthesis
VSVINKRIKVLECIRQGQIGGGESHLLSLVENIDRAMFEPVVLSFTGGPMIERLQRLGVPVTIFHTEKPFDIRLWKRVQKWLKEEKIDLVHAHGTRANSNVLWAAKSLHIPVVYTIHGWSFHDDQSFFIKKIRVWGERLLTAKSTINISVSETNRETGTHHFSGFQSVVINNGIDLNKFDPERQYKKIRQELNIPSDATVVLFLARFTLQKQPVTLIKSFTEAAEKNQNLFLIMVGDGEQRPEVEKIFSSSKFKNRIRVLPFREDVPDLLSAGDIFVLPSLWEGMPIALLEAMAMGKAIIATNADGTREILKHKKNGYLIDSDNLKKNLTAALLEVGEDGELRNKMGVEARRVAKENFGLEKMTRQIENVYCQILNN